MRPVPAPDQGGAGGAADPGRSARWIISLFAVSVLTQRLALPGGLVPLLLPLILAWCLYGLLSGLLEFHRIRTNLYLLAAGLTAGIALAQQLLVSDPLVSLTSWGLFMTVWAPATLRLTNRSRAVVRRAFEGSVRVGVVLASACLIMLGSQYLGLGYVDYLARVVPSPFLVQGYVITYPLQYDSPIYRANAWIGLEPSVISLQLGVCLVLALLVRASLPTLLVLIAGMVTTASGSGIFVVVIAGVVALMTPMRRQLVRYPLAIGAAAIALLLTPSGSLILSRVREFAYADSSTSLRAVEPYRLLWPTWTADPAMVLFGRGAGSSQALISATNRPGLLVPSPVKVLFDYGVIAGLVLAIFLVYCYYGAPSLALAAGLFGSSWLLQPGTTTVVLVVPTLLFVTWLAPRRDRYLEWDPFPRRRVAPTAAGVRSGPARETASAAG